jgi:Na+-translocating ferredoxin:NAD+ oxidoreductase RnfC subunit
VLAMVAGGLYYSADRHRQKELWKLKQQQDAEEKRAKWIRELEIRDEEDRAVREMMEKRRKKSDGKSAGKEEADQNGAKVSVLDAVKAAEAKKAEGGSTILGSIGGWFGGSKPSSDAASSAAEPPKAEPPEAGSSGTGKK